MSVFKDLTGKTFGRLVVVSRAENSLKGQARFLCKCECGKEKEISSADLMIGDTKSCGCLRREMSIKRSTTHGIAHKPLWVLWMNMKGRCLNKKKKEYKDYGGRGIKVCAEWLDGPELFFTWANSHGYKHGCQLDRKNNDKGYSPANCWFATPIQNARNKRLIKALNKSGYCGVHRSKSGRYISKFLSVYIGSYGDAMSAAIARDTMAMSEGMTINLPELFFNSAL